MCFIRQILIVSHGVHWSDFFAWSVHIAQRHSVPAFAFMSKPVPASALSWSACCSCMHCRWVGRLCPGLTERFLAMGSLGWARCYWCWNWEYNMYIPDGINRPLCGDCIDRLLDGQRPPYQPDNLARCANWLVLVLPAEIDGQRFPPDVFESVAYFLTWHDLP